MTADDPLFSTLRIGSLMLPNRVALAPMTRVSAEENGCPTPRMVEYYRDFAAGGFSLLVTEGIYTDQAYAQCYLHQAWLAICSFTRGDQLWMQCTQREAA